MQMPQIPPSWEATRLTLQRYTQALTAAPRSAAVADDRWTHVSMHPGQAGLTASPIPLADGTHLISTLDVERNRIVLEAGADTLTIDLLTGPSPLSVGESLASLASAHGTDVAADASRYEDANEQVYDTAAAAAWWQNTVWVVDTFNEINESIKGEITGPQLWPHGFDVATEWFSARTVEYDGADANAQIAIGSYPAGDGYFYVNPWPFEADWSDAELPGAATWHVEGWQGAKLMASDLGSASDREAVVALARSVHELARDSLT